MRSDSGQLTSCWMQTADVPSFSALQENAQTDVCIIGAGIAGLSTAYLLTQQGKSVVVLDDGPIAGGQTQRTTAHLANAIDDRYYEIERLHGKEGARLAAESHTAAIDQIERICATEGIACDFERLDGYLFNPPGRGIDELERELAAAQRAGLADVEMLERAPLAPFDTGPCLRFPQQGQFHPLKYLAGLAQAITRRGGRIFTQTHVERVEGGPSARVTTRGGHVVHAQAIVVATNVPINDRVALHTKMAAYLSYVVAGPVPRGSVARGLYWDTQDPYHYVRLQHGDGAGEPAHDLLVIGGEDHRTGQASDAPARFERLEAWARERFPALGPIELRWSGQVMETLDGLAFIGRNPLDADNVYVATGDSGMGMTHGTLAGMLLTDLLLGRSNPWANVYDPSRKPIRAPLEFLRENLKTNLQYADWVTGGDVSSDNEIPLDSGAVVRQGMTKLAVYRDADGRLHQCSAVCPHLGCIVTWNGAEKTWDCPCHGSRFDCFGKVINGPANGDLAPVEAAEPAAAGS